MANNELNECENTRELSMPQSQMYVLAKWFFLLSVLLKPFYIFASGKPQIADFMLILSLFALLLETRRIFIRKADEPLYIFVICVVIIQGIYFLIYQQADFLVTASYYIFNLAAVYVFNWFVKDFSFLRKLQSVLKINLLLQLVLILLGYEEGLHYRYRGTFNDPNQLSFYCMINFFLIYVIHYILEKNNLRRTAWWPWLIVTAYIIFTASSSGMLAGILIFVGIYFFENATNLNSKKQMIAILVIAVIAVMVFLLIIGVVQLPESITKDNRVYNKFKTLLSSGSIAESFTSFAQDRYLLPLLRYPERILYGAGEGMRSRFVGASGNEIHSTPLAILFYYGIVPWSFWMLWIVRKLRFVPRALLCAYAALIVETFTLINYRQPLFWMMLLIAETAGEASRSSEVRTLQAAEEGQAGETQQ